MACLVRILALISVAIGVCKARLTLEHLATEYVPMAYGPRTYRYNVDAAEQCAIDPNQDVVYVAGLGHLHVYDFRNPRDPRYLTHFTYEEFVGQMTDVETCGSWVVSSFENDDRPREGKVFFFRTFEGGPLTLLHQITVGVTPDMVMFTSDCKKVLVAIEGELSVDIAGRVFDPEGEVVVITFQNNPSDSTYDLQRIGFTQFNSREEELREAGIRKVYNGQGTSFTTTLAQDLEPEYIAISNDDRTAYIVLQENNALAEIDLTTNTVTDLYPFGTVSWNTGERMDASDRDGRIKMRSWDIKGMMLPDAAKLITIDGQDYILTANEGDAKDYEPPRFPFEWSERQRGNRFSRGDFDPSVSPELVNALDDNNLLGRLDFSTVDGIVNGRYSEFYSYGGRSFSMYRINRAGLTLQYNSGDDLEREFADGWPTIFHSNPNNENNSPENTFDTRSDNRGLEPEGIETGVVNGKTVIFVGMERPGVLALYSLDGLTPRFESMHYHGGFGPRTWEELWADRESWDTDPEDIRFIPAHRSPNEQPMIVVTGAYSGTLSFYNVIDDTSMEINRTRVDVTADGVLHDVSEVKAKNAMNSDSILGHSAKETKPNINEKIKTFQNKLRAPQGKP